MNNTPFWVDFPQMQNVVNQKHIDETVENLHRECQEKGEEFTKDQLKKFYASAQKVVASNTRNQTLASEVEQ